VFKKETCIRTLCENVIKIGVDKPELTWNFSKASR